MTVHIEAWVGSVLRRARLVSLGPLATNSAIAHYYCSGSIEPVLVLYMVSEAIRPCVVPSFVSGVGKVRKRMVQNALVRATSVVAFSALPLAAAVVFAGPSSAEAATQQATPVAGIPLQKSEDIATNPDALVPDPVLNGSSAGGSVGSAVGSATGSGDSILGSVIGALVGYFHPEVVPQVLP